MYTGHYIHDISFNTSYTLGYFSSLFYVCTKLLLKTKHFPSFRPQNSKKSVEVGLKQRRRNATPSNEELFVGAPTTGTHRRAWMSGNKSKNDRRFLRTLRVLRNDTAWGRLWDPADPASGAGIGYERYPMSQNRHPSAFAQGRLFTITLQWVGMGRSWRIIQLIPNRSCTCPKREAKNVSWMGMRMRPPCDSAEKTRSASLSLSTLNVR
jgi:hypothetical protein